MGHSGISGIVPSCSPSIKPCQSGKVSEEKCGLIALCVHFLLWLLSYREAYKEAYGAIWWPRRLIPRSQDDNMRGHLPIGVNAVFMNHGLQGIQICWKSMREKEKVTQWYRQKGGAERGRDKKAVLGISEANAPATSKAEHLLKDGYKRLTP